jgi:hypothetical protein
MTKPGYFIVSCDGGGIRGLITAMLLEDLDAKCAGFLKKVDLFAGTSTGGIIALGLAAGIPTSKIRQLYENEGGQIFVPFQPGLLELFGYVREYVDELLEPSPMAHAEAAAEMSAAGFGGLASTLRTIEDVFHVKYTADGLAGLLRKTFHARMMSDLQPVLVATYNIAPVNAPSWRPLLLTNLSAPRNAHVDALAAGDLAVVDVALATSAAPTFFPPHNVDTIGYCADGGLFANNPSLFALNSVISRKNPVSTIRMLSLGTGSIAQKVGAVPDPLAWGVGQWLLPKQTSSVPQLPLLQTLMDGQEQIADAQCAKVLRERYLRVDLPLTELYPLDDLQSIPAMVQETQDYIDGKTSPPGTPAWQDVVNWVNAAVAAKP